MTIPHTLAGLVPWIIANGYWLFFIAAVIEGSLVTTAAGVVAGLGFFNIFLVFLVSMVADLVGDFIYYFIGRSSRNVLHSKFFRFFGMNAERIKELERIIHTHTTKALLLIKLSPLIGPPGLISVGAVRVPLRKFFKTTLAITACKAVFFGLLGFLSAKSYLGISKFLSHGSYVIIAIAAIVIFIHILYRRFTKRLTDTLEQ
jgi:membrane protein DedA with SNARE-associated domain